MADSMVNDPRGKGEPIHSVVSAWRSYESDVLPADAPPVQRSETKRSFYAGAWFTLQVMTRLAEGDLPEGAIESIVGQITREIEAFYRGGG